MSELYNYTCTSSSYWELSNLDLGHVAVVGTFVLSRTRLLDARGNHVSGLALQVIALLLNVYF